jgi:ATP/maltotriose-dependent transcriptional regulator MalT
VTDAVELGREAYARRAWAEARALFATCDESLEGDDLERLAIASFLLGREDESGRALERAYVARSRSAQHDRAGHAAFWLGLMLFLRGETARAGGWIARAERSAEAAGGDCAVHGFVLVPTFIAHLASDPSRAAELADEMIAIAQRCNDADLLTLGVMCRGEAAVAGGDIERGLRLLDEAMLAVTTDELFPVCTGIVYCAVIGVCMDVLDIARAAQWTAVFDRWCNSQPDLVHFRGQCLIHRSQVSQLHGAWPQALEEAAQARAVLAEPIHPSLGLACYQEGELHRLRGEYDEAARAYGGAAECGHDPAPGAALLALATGDLAGARGSIGRMLAETSGPTRPPLLAAAVEIALAVPDLAAARVAADELTELARVTGVRAHDANAAYAEGTVLLAEGDAAGALVRLRAASNAWHELGVPYELARTSVQLARACRQIGDKTSADREHASAIEIFERLGAQPELQRLTRQPQSATALAHGVTGREREVLRLVASGKTNREIANELSISEHTVARHVQNLFAKLGVSSRSAATAYAYEHGVV